MPNPNKVLILTALGAMALGGCIPRPTIVGTWNGEAAGSKIELTCDAKGQFFWKSTVPQGSTVSVHGTYVLDRAKRKFTLTPKEATTTGFEEPLRDAVRKNEATMKQPMVFSYSFSSDEDLELTGLMGSISFDRVKESKS